MAAPTGTCTRSASGRASLAEERVKAVACFGLTECQSQFLAAVMSTPAASLNVSTARSPAPCAARTVAS